METDEIVGHMHDVACWIVVGKVLLGQHMPPEIFAGEPVSHAAPSLSGSLSRQASRRRPRSPAAHN
jgi:hypothetical protein